MLPLDEPKRLSQATELMAALQLMDRDGVNQLPVMTGSQSVRTTLTICRKRLDSSKRSAGVIRNCRKSPASTQRSTVRCPRVARLLPIPRRCDALGIQRYGFHGLSYVRAAEAVELFCYQIRKWIGAFAAVLGGLETLVFSGGIGENAGEVRSRICGGLRFLGIDVDEAKCAANAPVISDGASPVTVRVIHTNEEQMIARHLYRYLHDKAHLQGVQ